MLYQTFENECANSSVASQQKSPTIDLLINHENAFPFLSTLKTHTYRKNLAKSYIKIIALLPRKKVFHHSKKI